MTPAETRERIAERLRTRPSGTLQTLEDLLRALRIGIARDEGKKQEYREAIAEILYPITEDELVGEIIA
jgi:hypothetical protein